MLDPSEQPSGLDFEVDRARAVLDETPPDNMDRPGRLIALGEALLARHGLSDQLADLDEAIGLIQEALEAITSDNPSWTDWHGNLGIAFQSRYDASSQPVDLDEAIGHLKMALESAPLWSPLSATWRFALSNTLDTRYDATGQPADLDEAIEHLRVLLQLTPSDDPTSVLFGAALGIMLQSRYDATHQLADLDGLIEVYQALVDSPSNCTDQGERRGHLGKWLYSRFEATRRAADLDEAIGHFQAALGAAPYDNQDVARWRVGLGNALQSRYEIIGRMADLSQAIQHFRAALESTPPDSPELAGRRGSLGAALSGIYDGTDRPADLDEAIWLIREALRGATPDSPFWARWHSNLGGALQAHYEITGQSADLKEAITLIRKALKATPRDSSDWPEMLGNLGTALLTRYDSTRRPADLNEAIRHIEAAFVACPLNHPNRVVGHTNLGIALKSRYKVTDQSSDLDDAIGHFEAALEATPPDSPSRALALLNCGAGLALRDRATGQSVDLDREIQLYMEGLLIAPADGRVHDLLAHNLARAEHRRASASTAAGSAFRHSVAAAAEHTAPDRPEISAQLSLSYADGAFAARDWADAVQLYQVAFDARLLAFAVPEDGETDEERAAIESRRLDWERTFAGAGARAAYALVCDDGEAAAERATVMLEQGLLQGYQESFGLVEIDLARYTKAGHLGADRYRAARRHLTRLQIRAERGGGEAPSTAALAAARQEYGQALWEIQAKPGFAEVLLRADLAAVRLTATAAPLVYFGATEHGGMALIVPDAEAPIRSVDLPDLTQAAVEDLARRWMAARKLIHTQPSGWHAALDRTLRDLWQLGMGRIVEACHELNLKQAVLIAYGGSLAQMPWHAAYVADASVASGRRYALDVVTWRYGPSARLLGAPRHWAPRRGSRREILVARHDESPAFAEEEVAALASAMGRLRDLTRADVGALLQAWRSARYIHLIVHGQADDHDPRSSWLELAGGDRLTIDRLLRQYQSLVARLVVLATCDAAVTSGATGIDEIISFPAAFMRSGAGQVMAPFWAVDTMATKRLIGAFYRELGRSEAIDLATALARGAHELRRDHATTVARAAKPTPWWRRWMWARPTGISALPLGVTRGFGSSTHSGKASFDHSAPHYWACFALHGLPDQVG